jgi:hypothetical protein
MLNTIYTFAPLTQDSSQDSSQNPSPETTNDQNPKSPEYDCGRQNMISGLVAAIARFEDAFMVKPGHIKPEIKETLEKILLPHHTIVEVDNNMDHAVIIIKRKNQNALPTNQMYIEIFDLLQQTVSEYYYHVHKIYQDDFLLVIDESDQKQDDDTDGLIFYGDCFPDDIDNTKQLEINTIEPIINHNQIGTNQSLLDEIIVQNLKKEIELSESNHYPQTTILNHVSDSSPEPDSNSNSELNANLDLESSPDPNSDSNSNPSLSPDQTQQLDTVKENSIDLANNNISHDVVPSVIMTIDSDSMDKLICSSNLAIVPTPFLNKQPQNSQKTLSILKKIIPLSLTIAASIALFVYFKKKN